MQRAREGFGRVFSGVRHRNRPRCRMQRGARAGPMRRPAACRRRCRQRGRRIVTVGRPQGDVGSRRRPSTRPFRRAGRRWRGAGTGEGGSRPSHRGPVPGRPGRQRPRRSEPGPTALTPSAFRGPARQPPAWQPRVMSQPPIVRRGGKCGMWDSGVRGSGGFRPSSTLRVRARVGPARATCTPR